MGKRLNLVGKKFGRLMIMSDVGNDAGGNSLFLCQCDCGTERVVLGCHLRSGHTKSCGCYNRERMSEIHRLNLVGKKFSRLLVLEDVGNKNGRSCWKCLCDCGNKVVVQAGHLRNGHTKSCGCYNREICIERMKRIAKNQVGENHPWYGRHHTEESKKKMSKAQKGKNHNNWKGGITPENDRVRNSNEMKMWRSQVFERDNYICQLCGKRNCYLEAHHIYSFATYEFIRFKLWNGITLCKECHSGIRKKEHQFIRYN